MTEVLELFPVADTAVAPMEVLSVDRRRTRRQHAAIANGVHPLGLVFPTVRIHPTAGRPSGPADPGTGPTCGTCEFRAALATRNPRAYPKCVFGPGVRRATHGAATDVRAWWPACADHQTRVGA